MTMPRVGRAYVWRPKRDAVCRGAVEVAGILGTLGNLWILILRVFVVFLRIDAEISTSREFMNAIWHA